nr:CRISPR-associated helicase Cas3' [uncultured Butyrivibrio sp.]
MRNKVAMDDINGAVYPAHIDSDNKIQTVKEHCLGTADIAGKLLETVSLASVGKFTGIIHDMGKYTDKFKEYIVKAQKGEHVVRGSVNHTFSGVKLILDTYRKGDGSWDDLIAEITAYAVGAHHGLFDCINDERENGFVNRRTKQNIGYDEAQNHFFSECISKHKLDEMFVHAVEECKEFLSTCNTITQDPSEIMFYVGMTTKLVLSALIDADRIDTESFMLHKNVSDYLGNIAWNEQDKEQLWTRILDNVNNKVNEFEIRSDVDSSRSKISFLCHEAGNKKDGIYRLSVPTGGGKTLSSLRYAVNHARLYKKDRIIIVTPLLSIIDQNAEIIKDAIGDNSIVLEHHSDVIQEEITEEWNNRDLMIENWNAPVIVTTLVQLLNTIFAGKTSNIRRFHSLTNSVIMIDEVQTVPFKLLSMFNLAMNFLSYFCKCSIILASATQPCLEEVTHPLIYTGNLIDCSLELLKPFKRTEIESLGSGNTTEVIRKIAGIIENKNSVLIICNTKRVAEAIYDSLKSEYKNVFYVSTSLCMKHRQTVVKNIEKLLKIDQKVVCVSTQVLEAGVDISFSCVVRLMAGLDNIVQAAGRCNRSGEFGSNELVYVITCTDENLAMLKEIEMQKQTSIGLFHAYENNTGRFDDDIGGVSASEFYYKNLYDMMNGSSQGYFDDYVNGSSVYDLISINAQYADSNAEGMTDNYQLRQAFKKAADLFNVFESTEIDVLVPYGEGMHIISELAADRVNWDMAYKKQLISQAKAYSISLYPNQIEQLSKKGGLMTLCGGELLAIKNIFYSEEKGLDLDGSGNIYLEV